MCREIDKELFKLEESFGDIFVRIDVEEGEAEKSLYDELAGGSCVGVPFLYNQDNGKYVCGFVSAKEIEKTLQD